MKYIGQIQMDYGTWTALVEVFATVEPGGGYRIDLLGENPETRKCDVPHEFIICPGTAEALVALHELGLKDIKREHLP